MYLRFKPANCDDTDDVADTEYLRSLWQRIGGKYLATACAITGLTFTESSITVRCGKFNPSQSGNPGREAMRIGMHYLINGEGYEPARKSDDALIDVLSHELGHRLLHNHDIVVARNAPRRDYEVHRQLFVFLYNTWAAAFGEKRAAQIAHGANYPAHPEYQAYYEAWEWARCLSKRTRSRLTAYLAEHKCLPTVKGTEFVSLASNTSTPFANSWINRRADDRPIGNKSPWAKRYF